MSITISQSTEKEVEEFEKVAWKSEDIAHYGREIDWSEWSSQPIVLQAHEGDQMVGSVLASYLAGVLFIERLIVLQSHRGKGVGTSLMKHIEAYGRSVGVHTIYLHTGEHWETNEFYEKLGFVKTGELPKHFFRQDFVVYSKQID